MSSPLSSESDAKIVGPGRVSDEYTGDLDLGWLLHSKKDPPRRGLNAALLEVDINKRSVANSSSEPTPPETPVGSSSTCLSFDVNGESDHKVDSAATEGKEADGLPGPTESPRAASCFPAVSAIDQSGNSFPAASQSPKYHLKRPHLLARTSHQDGNKSPSQISPQGSLSPKLTARRASWITSLSSKFSSPGVAVSPRSSSIDAGSNSLNGPPSPAAGSSSPIGNAQDAAEVTAQPTKEQKADEKPISGPPRRPSVLVQAGRERDDHTSFLQSALRRLSSGSSAFGKGAGTCQIAQRKVMNVDHNRERVKIAGLEPGKLKRVAFCVDVEVAGHASWHEVEEFEAERRERKVVDPPLATRQSLSMLERQVQNVKDKKDKKDGRKGINQINVKKEAEGAALKNPVTAAALKEDKEASQQGAATTTMAPAPERQAITAAPVEPKLSEVPPDPSLAGLQPISGTRKKEKKKKSELERKQRKERKRRQAEADGRVPLELNGCNVDGGGGDSSNSPSPPGSSSPRWTHSPTSDPLRIYKRCVQLRETTAVDKVCGQISSPSSTLAESPGTVAVLDLSGAIMTLPELVTLSDWLAIVPVRKISLENCQLTDEGVRVILSGLLGCKTAEQARHNRRLPKQGHDPKGGEQLGVIEKISLKSNSKVTKVGWKHIALFLHVSRSLKAIDLSGIPFPPDSQSLDLSRSRTANTTDGNAAKVNQPCTATLGMLFSKALATRLAGNMLEELVMSSCALSTASVAGILDAASQCGLRRLGLAGNDITREGLECAIPYVKSGVCEGLDLSDNDLHDCMEPLSDVLTVASSFLAFSLSGCNLWPSDLKILLPSFVKLKNLRFVDLSSNPCLFSSQPNGVSLLRNYLPRMTSLKRIHLNDVGLSSEHAIALAEILPECPSLAHLSILDNQSITELMHSKDSAAQEEACALFASLMTAVRVSHSIIAVDIEVPSSESNDMLRALASQVVVYTLRNMEHGALKELEGSTTSNHVPGTSAPEILLHLVGNMEGYEESDDASEPAPDDHYLMGGNAIVKALGVCLGTAEERNGVASRTVTPTVTPGGSQASTPRLGAIGRKPSAHKKPRDMSKQLLESARMIKTRLKPALVREDRAGNDLNYRRLQFLDWTLQRMIQRFEDEYPECRLPTSAIEPKPSDSQNTGLERHASSQVAPSVLSDSGSEALDNADAENEPPDVVLTQTLSNASLASKALAHEEGRMHRYSQSVRREIALKADEEHENPDPKASEPAQTTTTTISDPDITISSQTSGQTTEEVSRLRALEDRFDNIRGDELIDFGHHCHRDGVEKALADVLGVTAQELLDVARSDPDAFEKFRQSQVAARINAEIE